MDARRATVTRFVSLVALASAVGFAAGCGSPDTNDADSMGLDPNGGDISSEEIRSVGSPPWIYTGPLPTLVNPKLTVSQAGHTLRVVGELPSDFTGTLPYWASLDSSTGRRMLTVVYPIATGASASFNAAPGMYSSLRGIPYLPNGMAYPSTGPTYVAWGGFPFMAYNGGIAFHGPITYRGSGSGAEQVYDWYLLRGPVSHGCNRMQGEHVVELAHLVGFDMRNTWAASSSSTRRVSVTVTRDYDRLPSGEAVDVDYPRAAGARAPSGQVRMFQTWSADELPRVVCADTRTRRSVGTRVGMDFCNSMPANSRDLVTGNPLGPVLVDNVSSAFSTTGTWGRYTRSPVRVGADYAAAAIATAGTATWRLPVTASGRFTLRARYAPDENRNTRCSYQVFTDGTASSGQTALVVNQRLQGNQGWVDLGTFTLSPGARVVLTSLATSDGWTIADAVRVEPAP